MPYDEQLAARIRDTLGDRTDVDEKRMFGGMAFLVHGHMAVCASSQGGLLARVDPVESPGLVERPGVTRMVMGGREMDGWLRVSGSEVAEDAALDEWVARGVAFVGTLPPK